MSDTLDLTLDLMARNSVTPTDGGCQQVMMQRLGAAGFEVEPLRYGVVDNFWAKRGGADGPAFCFAGHTDVVPTGPLEEWQSDPFRPTIRDGVLYGRGAADMKSGLAAMVTATGCGAVMIGRGALGRPWIFQGDAPSREQRAAVIRRHATLIEAHLPERLALVQLKKHLSWYADGLPFAARTRPAERHIVVPGRGGRVRGHESGVVGGDVHGGSSA